MVQLITIKCQILGGLLMAKFAISRALKKMFSGKLKLTEENHHFAGLSLGDFYPEYFFNIKVYENNY